MSPPIMSGTIGAQPPGAPQPYTQGTPKINGVDATYVKRTSGYSENDIVNDAWQGASLDCYFIAALYSYAWANTTTFPKPTATNPPATIRFNWMDDLNVCYYNNYPVDKSKIWLTVSGTPACAGFTPENEIWCAIYEQAYATMKGFPNRPQDLGPGCPMQSLQYLLSTYKFSAVPFVFKGDPNPHATLFDDIKTLSSGGSWTSFRELNTYVNWSTDSASAKTKYPTVAWTYPLEHPGRPSYGYNDSLIVAKHAYSILGLFRENSKEFIVLRNPWGVYSTYVAPDPNKNPDIVGNLATGTYNPPSSSGAGMSSMTFSDPLTKARGIFALERSVFEKYFFGFGWVQMATCSSTKPGQLPV